MVILTITPRSFVQVLIAFIATMLDVTLAPSVIAAQIPAEASLTLKGIVRDAGGHPLSLADVSTSDGRRAWTTDNGEFTLSNVQRGLVILTVRRVGYLPVASELDTQADVTTVSLQISLVPNAQKLGTVIVEGKSLDNSLLKLGFYQRKKGASGFFFDGDEVSSSAAPLTTMLTALPSMRMDTPPGGGGLRVPVARKPDGLGYCAVNVYLDSQYLPWAHEVGVDNLVSKSDIRAMELYPRELGIPSEISSRLGKTIMRNGSGLQGARSVGGRRCAARFLSGRDTTTGERSSSPSARRAG